MGKGVPRPVAITCGFILNKRKAGKSSRGFMGARLEIARAIGAVSTWGLKNVLHRPAANFPGKVGLYADPHIIADLRPLIREGAIVVVGTNGKTTVTNLVADAFERAGKTVVCNRTGANLDSGIATALLHAREADWGVFECDELWLAKVAPQLKPDYVVLLNLFRDQLDRVGEIGHIQESIAAALASSPATVLIYNADDPLCQAIADSAENRSIPFGLREDLQLPQNSVADGGMCQRCDGMLEYAWRQYGQLGNYQCPTCGFARTEPVYAADDVQMADGGAAFTLHAGMGFSPGEKPIAPDSSARSLRIEMPLAGAYLIYNVLAAYAATDLCGVPAAALEEAIGAFDPKNGRLQMYEIDGHRILLNLAKNPTGFNQNLRIVCQDAGPAAVAFFINDKEADGHDVSWLWDVDFQELADAQDLTAFAGGLRRNDMQVRLKYAGVDAALVDGAADFLAKARGVAPDATFYLIANYTALPVVKEELDRMQHLPAPHVESVASAKPLEHAAPVSVEGEKLVIAHMYPTLLNLYGDGGNAIVLAQRAQARGMEVELVRAEQGEAFDIARADIVYLGGGPDREQRLASHELLAQTEDLRAYVEDDGVLLAICGGYQIIGREWLLGDELVPGLGLVDITTGRAEGGSHNRLVGNIVLDSPLARMPVVGYENHAGRTFLGSGCQPFGHVIGHHGHGNNDADRADGVLYRNVVGTYLHGPLLAKNPEIADWLIERALARRAAKQGCPAPTLPPLDDVAERAANEAMRHRLGV